MITQERVNELLEYRDGELFWKTSTGNVKIGSRAGCLKGDGYRYISIEGKQYKEHRLVFLLHNGYFSLWWRKQPR